MILHELRLNFGSQILEIEPEESSDNTEPLSPDMRYKLENSEVKPKQDSVFQGVGIQMLSACYEKTDLAVNQKHMSTVTIDTVLSTEKVAEVKASPGPSKKLDRRRIVKK